MCACECLVNGPALLSPFCPWPGFVTSGDDRLAVVIDEMQDLKGVWVELGKIVEQLDDIKDKPWLSVQPRKVRT